MLTPVIGPGRYSPPKVVRAERHVVEGKPDQKHISTSLVERQNLTMRMGMRRFTRLTNAFSKKAENHRAAVGLHFAHYNFVRQHKTIRMTLAMAAGMESSMWPLEELVDRTSRKPRQPYKISSWREGRTILILGNGSLSSTPQPMEITRAIQCFCGQQGTAIWDETEMRGRYLRPLTFLISVSEGFSMQVHESPLGETAIICGGCQNAITY